MPKTMPAEVKQSLKDLLDYVEPQEREHFETADVPDAHIYNDVIAVRSWLEGGM